MQSGRHQVAHTRRLSCRTTCLQARASKIKEDNALNVERIIKNGVKFLNESSVVIDRDVWLKVGQCDCMSTCWSPDNATNMLSCINAIGRALVPVVLAQGGIRRKAHFKM